MFQVKSFDLDAFHMMFAFVLNCLFFGYIILFLVGVHGLTLFYFLYA